MIVNNPWVGYLDRSFQQIKSAILLRLGETIPEMTDHSDSNIMVIVIEAFAGVSEQLNYYIDNMAREAFITTARRYSSIVKHTRLVDYRIKAIVPSSLDMTLEFKTLTDEEYTLPTDVIIPSGITFSTANGIPFMSTKDTVAKAGSTFVTIETEQKQPIVGVNLGTTGSGPDQAFSLGFNYVNDSIELTVGPDIWTLVKTFGFSGPTSKVFIVDISANKEAYVKFGDGINGAIPTTGSDLVGDYYTSYGKDGDININTITSVSPDLTTLIPSIPLIEYYNQVKGVGGTDYEDIERIRRSAPLSLRTLDRAVTEPDYEDIALLCPGVNKAKVYFNCGKFVYIYVSPNGGGIANTTFLNNVKIWFDDKKMITTFVKPQACGESQIFIDLVVTGRFRVNGAKLRADILELLLDAYSYDKSDINKTIRVSDLISLIDNYPTVDFLKLNNLYLKPSINPYGTESSTPNQLNHTIELLPGSQTTINWRVVYQGVSNFLLLKENVPYANLTVGTPFIDPGNVLLFTINAGTYVVGDEWRFKTLATNNDLVLDDYSIPIMVESTINLVVNEQLSVL